MAVTPQHEQNRMEQLDSSGLHRAWIYSRRRDLLPHGLAIQAGLGKSCIRSFFPKELHLRTAPSSIHLVLFFFLFPFPASNRLACQYCLIYQDNFATLDKNIWSHEVQLDGYGTGSFDWTTTDEKNSYVDSSGLHIVPTLTNETTSITNHEMFANYRLDLTKDGSCTSKTNTSCITTSDPIKGSMIPPVRSARLSTKGKKSIRYGKVEVVAKLPKGDWIWPAICKCLCIFPRQDAVTHIQVLTPLGFNHRDDA